MLKFLVLGSSLSHSDTAEQTPLVHAAKNGHRDTVIYLLGCQTGRDDRNSIDIEDGSIEQLVPGSRHALIAAAQNGHLDIVEYLLDTAELIVSTLDEIVTFGEPLAIPAFNIDLNICSKNSQKRQIDSEKKNVILMRHN